ncbi:GPR endopeptidase [Bacillus pacificus]
MLGINARNSVKRTLGIPVIAIELFRLWWMPFRLQAVTIDFILKHFGREMKEGNKPSRSLLPAGFTFGEKKKINRRICRMKEPEYVF